ncbi:MutS protein-like 5 [Exaiptasia diaphana]|nr:MutS protein-like 5 [Exaiptasia diaphana]
MANSSSRSFISSNSSAEMPQKSLYFTPANQLGGRINTSSLSSSGRDNRNNKRRLSSDTESTFLERKRPQPLSLIPTATRTSLSSSANSSACSTGRQHNNEDLCEEDVVSHRNMNNGRLFDDDEEGSGTVKTVLSTVWSGGKLGASYYDTDNAQIYLMMDIVETSDFEILKRVKDEIKPDIIITSSKQDDRFLAVLEGQEGENNEEPMVKVKEIEILPTIDFSLEVCKRRIISINGLPGMPQHFNDMERNVFFSSLIPFDNVNMVRSAGALLKYLEKKRFGLELEDPDVPVPILALKVFSLQDMVIVDDNTYRKETHPSVYKQGTSSKEGLSLFGVMNRTRSSLGSRLLRIWFMRPTRNLDVLKQRQTAIGFFMASRNQELVASLQDCLKNMKNISRILSRMKTAQASVTDWQALYKTVYNAVYLTDLCRTIPSDIKIATKVKDHFTHDLPRIASLINKIVDFDESVEQNRFVVKPGVDPVLDEKKRTYNGLPDFMTKVAREELNKLQASITECNVIYLPQLGYLLAIPRTADMKEEKDFEMDGLEFVFLSNNMVYYKSQSTKELDELLGDTQCEITDHETAIMHRLQCIILDHTKVLLGMMECAAEFDCLLSLTICAHEGCYVRPEMTSEPIFDIKGGRHPLQELCVSQFVPNDTVKQKDKDRMTIITGPNASGKSVYLKQVGLITFMAHIGSFVPAEKATIGTTDRIFTRIHTRETVSVGLSTFMIDLGQVATAVQEATEHSLVIIDEFGKGTATVDGLSLLCATLKHWIAKQEKCPRIVVSTHFHSLIRQSLLPDTPFVHYQTTEVMQDGEELVFLYQLVEGHANCSYACHIAQLAGVPADLVKRSAEVSEMIRCNKPLQRRDSLSLDVQQKRFSTIVNRFVDLNLEEDDLSMFLSTFVLPVSHGQNPQ